MRLGVIILPEQRWAQARALWQRAEQLGFDHAWTYDHLAWRTLRDGPWFGAVPTLTAAALATSRIRLGTMVATPNFRHPVSFAKELITLDDVSEGRLTVGLGAGGRGWDATVFGEEPLPLPARASRFTEFVADLDELLREPEASFSGEFYTAVEARTYPGCVQQPRVPFVVAAYGPRAMRVAARHGQAWVTTNGTGTPGAESFLPDAREQLARLREICADEGRDPAELDAYVVFGTGPERPYDSPEALADLMGRYAEAGYTDLVLHWPRGTEPHRGDLTAFEAAVTHVTG